MLFVRTNDLKTGMRLARPIYNKDGVLLYERNSKLSHQGITSIKNFGLIGIFVLEPAEPVPPMTKDDIEFERFQTMAVFSIQEELNRIIQTNKAPKIQSIVANVIRNYGHLDKKINFVQNLRSTDDYVYKHSLNVAILCAMIAHTMNIKIEDKLDTVISAVVHDIGKLTLPKLTGAASEIASMPSEQATHHTGMELVEHVFGANVAIKRICMQCHKVLENFERGAKTDIKIVVGAKILVVAKAYDMMTAMQVVREPRSEVEAIRTFFNHPEVFDSEVVEALIQSINILNPGTCIELNTGEKGLVLVGNEIDILRPIILLFNDNQIIDLSNEFIYGDLEIKDIMKTMDNRYIFDLEMLKKQGIMVNLPVFVEVTEENEYIPGQF